MANLPLLLENDIDENVFRTAFAEGALVKQKFAPAKRDSTYSRIADSNWNDCAWQISESRKLSQFGCVTPYYLGLIDRNNPTCQIGRLAQSGFFNLPETTQNLLLAPDSIFNSRIEAAPPERIVLNTNVTTLLPMRIDEKLIASLKRFDQVFVHMHFNHPRECTWEAYNACTRLADAGFILNNTMTLFAGINDDPSVVKELNHRLLMMRVRPYSIFNNDVSNLKGSLQAPAERGVEIIEALRGWTSGLAVPHYVVRDSTGDHLKIPNYVKSSHDGIYIFRNYKNNEYQYQDS